MRLEKTFKKLINQLHLKCTSSPVLMGYRNVFNKPFWGGKESDSDSISTEKNHGGLPFVSLLLNARVWRIAVKRLPQHTFAPA